MAHENIFEMFKSIFPVYAERTTEYFPCGKNTIRARLGSVEQEFIFTFHSDKEWRFETIDTFIKDLSKTHN